MKPPPRAQLVVLGVWTLAVAAPFLGQAFHMDETLYLAVSRHILEQPLHPLDFLYNWHGSLRPVAPVFNNPVLFPYLLAGVMKVSGGGEFWTRLLLLPLDLLAAFSLYGLARRFLKEPLLPVLLVLAAPAYLVNMNHAMAEKALAAFGFLGLYAAARAGEQRRPLGWWALAAAALAAASLCKYSGLLFLPPALVLARRGGLAARGLAALAAGAAAPLALCLAVDAASGADGLRGAWTQTAVSAASSWPAWAHRLRALLAFTGACGGAVMLWPFWRLRGSPARLLAALAAAVLLFSPLNDSLRPVLGLDRLTGLLFALAGAAGLLSLAAPEAKGPRGGAFWAVWAGSAALLQVFVYWSVTARLVLFILVPLILSLCEVLEAELGRKTFSQLCGASLAASAALSLSLAWVDRSYAEAQRDAARDIVAPLVARGRRVLFTGHWGLQHYLERAGALPYDAARPPADQARPGDMLFVSMANSNTDLRSLPEARLVGMRDAAAPLPLRLLTAWGGSPQSAANQAAFYASTWGFLPFALSREPLDRFLLLETAGKP